MPHPLHFEALCLQLLEKEHKNREYVGLEWSDTAYTGGCPQKPKYE